VSASPTTSGVGAGPVNPRVLVADDDPTVVLLMEHALEGLGRDYDTADNGTAAWESWQEKRQPLVVLDIEMPGMDGLEICRRIREADAARQTYILIVTGRDKAADLEAVLTAGADDYLTKPTTGQRLLARLRIALRRMGDDAARRLAEEELRKSRWLAGIGEATMTLQHEINNPLTGLMATAEMMLMDAEEQGKPTGDLRTILDQARRISALVKKMGELRDPKSVPYAGGDSRMLDLGDKS
jgi:DNA-binding response OmpR family regulator